MTFAGDKTVKGLSARLSERQFQYLRRVSCDAGVSMSEYLRLLLERDRDERAQCAAFTAAVRRGTH
jgi:hypothetical protein